MSEPIDELLNEYETACLDIGCGTEWIAKLKREVAALRERAERAEQLNRDYEEVNADKKRLVRELDVAMHGEEGAAQQASLCDLVGPAKKMRQRIADLEAERAALMAAGDLIASECTISWAHNEDIKTALDIFAEQPGALAAWLAKEGR